TARHPPRPAGADAQHREPARSRVLSGIPAPPVVNQTWFGRPSQRAAWPLSGELTSAGVGSGDIANGPDAFWNQGFSGADIGAQPRTAREIVRRVCRHLRRNVPVSGSLALDHAANIGARGGISRSHFHYSA